MVGGSTRHDTFSFLRRLRVSKWRRCHRRRYIRIAISHDSAWYPCRTVISKVSTFAISFVIFPTIYSRPTPVKCVFVSSLYFKRSLILLENTFSVCAGTCCGMLPSLISPIKSIGMISSSVLDDLQEPATLVSSRLGQDLPLVCRHDSLLFTCSTWCTCFASFLFPPPILIILTSLDLLSVCDPLKRWARWL